MAITDFISMGTAVNDFIDYALFVVGILIAYYLFRFLMGASEEGEGRAWGGTGWDRLRRRGSERGREQDQDRNRDRDQRRAHQNLRRYLPAILGYIVNVNTSCRDMANVLRVHSDVALRRANNHLGEIRTNIERTVAGLHGSRRHIAGDMRNNIRDLEHWVDEFMEHYLHDEIEARLPEDAADADWDDNIHLVRAHLTALRTRAGYIERIIEGLIRDGSWQALTPAADVRPENPPRRPY
jgi:hypothetical protein